MKNIITLNHTYLLWRRMINKVESKHKIMLSKAYDFTMYSPSISITSKRTQIKREKNEKHTSSWKRKEKTGKKTI
jgi:hypothetical protein